MSWLPTANSYTSVLNPNYDRQNAATSLYSHYNYIPNRGFNIFAAIVWALVFLAHLYWLIARQRRVAETGFVAKGRTRSIQSLFLLGSVSPLPILTLNSLNQVYQLTICRRSSSLCTSFDRSPTLGLSTPVSSRLNMSSTSS